MLAWRLPRGTTVLRQPWVMVLLLWLVFALVYQASVPLRASQGARITADEPFYLMTTHSLLTDGDLDLWDEYTNEDYRHFYDHPEPLWLQSQSLPDGRILSPHNAGLSVLVLPAYALGGLNGVKTFLGILGGLVVALTFLLSWQLTGRYWASAVAAAALAISAPLFIYSTQIYPEMAAALVVVAACCLLTREDQPSWGRAFLLSLAPVSLMWLGSKYAPLAAIMALLAIAWLPRRQGALAGLLLALGGIHYLWFHLDQYGGLTPYSVNAVYSGSDTFSLMQAHLDLWPRAYRLLGLWMDREFGLWRWAPVLLLVLPGLFWALRSPRRWDIVLLSLMSVQILLATFFSITMRGWWFPGRMLIPVLPLAAVYISRTMASFSGRQLLMGLAGLVIAYTAVVTLGLQRAVAAREVTLAVDPFAMSYFPFAAVKRLFPLYTSFTWETYLLSGLWLTALAMVGLLSWSRSRKTMASLVAWLGSIRPVTARSRKGTFGVTEILGVFLPLVLSLGLGMALLAVSQGEDRPQTVLGLASVDSDSHSIGSAILPGQTVAVTLGEGQITAVPFRVAAGGVRFVITNVAQRTHGMAILRDGQAIDKIEYIRPGQTRELVISLSAGSYELAYRQHYQQGQRVNFTVQ